MTHIKRKKNSRQRGSWTHGWGAKKKHRGAGHRGGRGRAGSGKKGDAKKTLYWKDKGFGKGKMGFTSLANTKIKTINISHLDSIIDKLVLENKANKKGDVYDINLMVLGYNKLLGSGKVLRKINITIKEASQRAKEKIEKAGGKITVLSIQNAKDSKDKSVKDSALKSDSKKKSLEPVKEKVEENE